jgi:hypothetical protein
VQGSAGFVAGALAGQQADVVYLGVGQLGVQSAEYIRTYWRETVRAVGARRVVLIHRDDFSSTDPLRSIAVLATTSTSQSGIGALARQDQYQFTCRRCGREDPGPVWTDSFTC